MDTESVQQKLKALLSQMTKWTKLLSVGRLPPPDLLITCYSRYPSPDWHIGSVQPYTLSPKLVHPRCCYLTTLNPNGCNKPSHRRRSGVYFMLHVYLLNSTASGLHATLAHTPSLLLVCCCEVAHDVIAAVGSQSSAAPG